ncbi:hypothetical protein K1W54_24585 [Micromonospora sp. CPCC 205371]|nr:hypothetical protein [Micromonospora sp. CPCC 205371]
MGTIVADWDQWAAHPGDLVPLTALLDPDWRFPTDYRRPSATDDVRAGGASPDLWADGAGMQWLGVDLTHDGALTGELPPGLRDILRRLLSGRRVPDPHHSGAFEPANWQVAIVAAHIAPDDACADLPVVGSVVAITDSEHAEHDAARTSCTSSRRTSTGPTTSSPASAAATARRFPATPSPKSTPPGSS